MANKVTAWILMATMFFTPTAALSQNQPNDESAPPVAQPLVREGTFALKLANSLGLGTTTNEAEAESTLSAAGIAPKNGWVADYPVTPDVMSELREATLAASASGYVQLNQVQAEQAFQAASAQYAMNIAQAPTQPPDSNVIGTSYYGQPVLENFYSTGGPPVVTYYEPPADYSYLYSWVPYPFWWWGWWFAGYWILGSFIYPLGHHGYYTGAWYGHHGWHGSNYWYSHWDGQNHWGDQGHSDRGNHSNGSMVSSHFRDPATRTMRTVNTASGAVAISATRTPSTWPTSNARTGARAIYDSKKTATRTATIYGQPATNRATPSSTPLNNATRPRMVTSNSNYRQTNHSYTTKTPYPRPLRTSYSRSNPVTYGQTSPQWHYQRQFTTPAQTLQYGSHGYSSTGRNHGITANRGVSPPPQNHQIRGFSSGTRASAHHR